MFSYLGCFSINMRFSSFLGYLVDFWLFSCVLPLFRLLSQKRGKIGGVLFILNLSAGGLLFKDESKLNCI